MTEYHFLVTVKDPDPVPWDRASILRGLVEWYQGPIMRGARFTVEPYVPPEPTPQDRLDALCDRFGESRRKHEAKFPWARVRCRQEGRYNSITRWETMDEASQAVLEGSDIILVVNLDTGEEWKPTTTWERVEVDDA